MNLLELQNVTLKFAGLTALNNVSLSIPKGSVFAVIGPNGAGQTSLFNCISGGYRPQSGALSLAGTSLVGAPPHAIAARGVARMFQNLALFDNLTTLQNLLLGAHHGFRSSVFHDLLWTPRARREEVRQRAAVE